MKILITGAGGFIGKNLVFSFLTKHQVVALDINEAGLAVLADRGVQTVVANLADQQINFDFLTGVDLVVHLAGNPFNLSDLEKLFRDNVMSTNVLLKACADHGVKKFILASTSDVYGGGKKIFTESDPTRPSNYYGLSKLFAEEVCFLHDKLYGIKSLILRLASMYGPGNPKGLFFTLLKNIKDKGAVILAGDGRAKRNSVYIEDLIGFLNIAVNSSFNQTAIYNLAGKEIFDLNQVVKVLQQNLSQKFNVEYNRVDNVADSLLDITKVSHDFAWKPQASLDNTIKEIIEKF